jgi:hypothetical protein
VKDNEDDDAAKLASRSRYAVTKSTVGCWKDFSWDNECECVGSKVEGKVTQGDKQNGDISSVAFEKGWKCCSCENKEHAEYGKTPNKPSASGDSVHDEDEEYTSYQRRDRYYPDALEGCLLQNIIDSISGAY